jgi:hypothetical protein
MKLGVICQACGVEAPAKHVEFHQNIGALVMRYHKCIKGNLCKRCVHKYFWSTTSTTVAIGWLGTISLVLAPCFVINNLARYLAALGMPPVPPGATPPIVTDEVGQRLGPKLDEIFGRLNRLEDLSAVARDIAPGCGVTPGQVVKFVALVMQSARQPAVSNPPTGGFPVLPPRVPPPVPVRAIPVEE